MNLKTAVKAIDRHGILLVFPLDNRKEPPSIWSAFYPKTEMRWEWDELGDGRVAKLWHLRSELSSSGQVIYSKWYQGRATVFSKAAFVAMMAITGTTHIDQQSLSDAAREILHCLTLDSPLSTKQLKDAVDMRGKAKEPQYERAMKELWSRLLIVGYGEVDDGAFPSLAVGTTCALFEPLWEKARKMNREEGLSQLQKLLPKDSLFLKKLEVKAAKAVKKSPKQPSAISWADLSRRR